MSDHKYPLQMECLSLAVASLGPTPDAVAVLARASAFLGWVQATKPTASMGIPSRPRLAPFGDPLEGPVR
jgi:hypothetical protein